MAQLGKAYIEVRADLSKFPTELRAELEKALKEGTAGLTFEELDKKAGAAGKKAANTVGNEFEKESKKRLKKTGENAGKDLGEGFFSVLHKVFSGNSSGGFFSTVGDLFKGLSSSVQDGTKQIQSAGEQIKGVTDKIGNAFSGITGGVQSFFYSLLVPAITAGIALLVQLSGAILAVPAAIAVLLAAIAPLIIALHGVSDAIGAGLSGNTKKFDEALKKLAPSARAVVREIVGLKPAFEAIKNSTQQAFFTPLIGSFKALQGTLLPALNRGLALAASALGKLVATFLDLLAEPGVIAAITQTFTTLAAIVERITPTAIRFFRSMFDLIQIGLPFVERFATYLTEAGDAFVTFLNKASASGKVANLIDRAAQPFKELIRLVAVFGDLFFTIFGNSGVQQAGNDFLVYLTKAIGLLDKFFHSAEGKKIIKDLADALEHAGVVLVGVAAVVIGLLEALHYLNLALKVTIESVAAFFQFIGGLAVTAGKAVGEFFAFLGRQIAHFFVDLIPQAFHAVVNFFVSIGSAIGDFFTKTIPSWFRAIGNFFSGLPKQAGDGAKSFRDSIINGFRDAFVGLVDLVARNIGRVIGLILAAPVLIRRGLSALGTIIHDAFFSALHATEHAVEDSVNAIGHFFSTTLPNAIESGLSSIGHAIVSSWNAILNFFSTLGPQIAHFFVGVYHAIVDGITSAVKDAKDFVVNGFNDIVHFFATLPEKIAALGPKLLNAARDLGRQIGNGLRDIGNFASDIGKDIVNAVKSGINHIIRSINAGINDVGNSIGVHLPNIPQLARGGIIDSPTLAILGEGSKREVVIPLTDPARAQQLAQQSGLTQVLARGAGQPIVNVTAILGTGQILDILDTRVETAFSTQGAELSYGPRS